MLNRATAPAATMNADGSSSVMKTAGYRRPSFLYIHVSGRDMPGIVPKRAEALPASDGRTDRAWAVKPCGSVVGWTGLHDHGGDASRLS